MNTMLGGFGGVGGLMETTTSSAATSQSLSDGVASGLRGSEQVWQSVCELARACVCGV